ncbi:hypothetical protein IEQ34_017204 [Dendrobium chrysotoxum]|uniref:GTP-binding protein n=1 Tax=Dendrobium chrysotoxum TaxID=161865 RepID=A0AAV7FTA6_DENCH|nr:hypothetical protein IEQ34_017204 [Dendrobium chrysotoxum]
MIWEDRVRDNREHNGGPPCGQVRVLVAGDSGVGKTSLVHLIVKGCATSRPSQTVGCTVEVRHITHGSSGSSSSIIKGDAERDFFVELWDISGHERYKDCRSLFYKQINGVIFVHDLSQRRTKSSLHKWAAEIAATGTFSAPLESGGPGGLPVPYLVIGNKTDLAANDGGRVSSGNLVDVARQWVEKQGLLPSSEELPLTESFPGSSGLRLAAKEARYDKEAITKFFEMLVRRRYFSDDLPSPSTWSTYPVQSSVRPSGETLREEDEFLRKLSISGDKFKYDVLPPLPAQSNLPPPRTLYPQQPVSVLGNFSFSRYRESGTGATGSNRPRRADISV